jgi:hypothetical protein
MTIDQDRRMPCLEQQQRLSALKRRFAILSNWNAVASRTVQPQRTFQCMHRKLLRCRWHQCLEFVHCSYDRVGICTEKAKLHAEKAKLHIVKGNCITRGPCMASIGLQVGEAQSRYSWKPPLPRAGCLVATSSLWPQGLESCGCPHMVENGWGAFPGLLLLGEVCGCY